MTPSVEFWSSVELGTFARGLLRELGEQGWDAEQRFAVSEADYRRANGVSDRFRLRWNSYVSYVRSLRRRLRESAPPDALVVCTNTFYAPAIALRSARAAGVPVVHWVFDLFPDVLVQGGKLRAGGPGESVLKQITRWTFQQATANVFLGVQVLRSATERYGSIPKSVVIPVGADGRLFRHAIPRLRAAGEPVRILYCGNLGRMHDTDTVVDFLRQRGASGWTMEFRGHGSAFRSLAAAVATTDIGRDVTIGDSLPDSDWTAAMLASDVALVTMKRGAEGLVMPSKTYSALMAGQAILAICPRESDLAEVVLRHDAGWVVEPGDVAGLNQAIAVATRQPQTLLRKRLNAFHAGHQCYDSKILAGSWSNLLKSVMAGPPAGPGKEI